MGLEIIEIVDVKYGGDYCFALLVLLPLQEGQAVLEKSLFILIKGGLFDVVIIFLEVLLQPISVSKSYNGHVQSVQDNEFSSWMILKHSFILVVLITTFLERFLNELILSTYGEIG